MAKRKRTFESFEDWRIWDLKQKLGIQRIENTPLLLDWTGVQGQISPEWKPMIEKLRLALFDFYPSWKEDDLKMNFIAPLLFTIPFQGENFYHFAHAWLSAKVGGFEVKGFVDWMVATGLAEPEAPYFFLHEYKQMGSADPDPEGQLLIAMLAAQQMNNDGQPVYGCYVFANYWRFVVLSGNSYSISEGFDATQPEELTKIWLILDKTNQMATEWAKNRPIS